MPTKITVTGANAGVLDYKYSANGIKLQKIKTQGGNTTTTDYAGNYVYENNVLKQFNHPEGYVEPDGSGYQYVYRLTDIWGNTRITFADDNNNGSVNSSEIRREQNYYPFGMEHQGYNGSSYGVKNNLKTYQKQEFTEDLGLNTHEWKYRVSDPAIGRFWQVDPLAEDYVYNSTYAFQENKMGMGIELEGLELSPFHGGPFAAKKWNDDVKKHPEAQAFMIDQLTDEIPGVGEAKDIANGNYAMAAIGIIPFAKKIIKGGGFLLNLAKKAFKKSDNVADVVVDATAVEKRAEKLNKVDRSGKDFTKAGKENVIDQNKLKNNGKTICEGCSTETIPATQDVKGVSTPKNRTEVDHIKRKRDGGRGNPDNGQVLCNGCNNEKG